MKQFGKLDVYDNTKLNLANISRIPGSRGEVKVMLGKKGVKGENGTEEMRT